ncbi:TetR/AcrR family transcriptional regulator [Sphingobium sp. SCG-1]|uniref:TetR/AcrR family transcriptional regulator n=1 Tax=Sphingobium sp. SCG-1 TaxID=2072936 RepID=UPI000CD6998F|nr:TetR/AcrR family transcriptional regulator [Sphingobium sp. SCG-1]AUW59565.1 TetR/AcrR family transcriptional regulator [Sphingobium sp. SCG-1]
MALASGRTASAPRSTKAASVNGPTQQSLKSAQTRARLIDATIRCIVKFGYANTTTPQVAAEAGLSRGAMLHHFENGSALIKATIVELHEKRLRAFRRAAEITEHEPATMVNTYWRQLQKPGFIAFHELALAARTNADLARILQPLQLEFRQKFNSQAVLLFPEWQDDPVSFELAMTLSQTMIEGMAINLLTKAIDESMVEPMLRLLEQQIRLMKPASRGQSR